MQTSIPLANFRPDVSRISATSAAIALNGVLLLFLIAPMTPPVIPQDNDEDVIILPPLKPEPVEPPKVEVEKVPVRTVPHPQPAPRPQTQPTPVPDTPPAVDSQPGDTQAFEQTEVVGDPPADTGPVGPADDGKPMDGAHLQYASAPPPPYPREALQDELTGTVMLEVLVDVDGKPLDVRIARSSGHRVLDAAARKQVLAKWSFKPAMRNGRAVQAIGTIPVEFRLD